MTLSVLDFPNSEAGRAGWLASIEANRKSMLVAHRKALRALKDTALPCPFCGKAPTIGPVRPDLEGGAWGFVTCVNGRCPVQPQAKDGSNISDERGSAAYIALAIRRWNRRG